MKNLLQTKYLFPLALLILFGLAFIFDTPKNVFLGLIEILKSPSVLISDYLRIGGLGASLFNVAGTLLITYF